MKVGVWRHCKLRGRSMAEPYWGFMGKSPQRFYVRRVNNSLKQQKHSKLIYFECKLGANLFLYTSKQCFMKIEFQNSIRRLSFLYRRPDIKTVRINPCDPLILKSETYPEPWKTSEMELFAKIVKCFQPLTISVKSSISNV